MRITPIRAVEVPKIAPTVRAPLGITSGFAQGLGQLGQAVGDVGQVAQQIGLRKKYFDDTTSLSALTDKFKVSIADHLGLMQATAYDDMDKEHKDGMTRIRQAGADEAGKVNPEVSANWKKLWNTLEADTNIKFGRIYREKFRQNAIAGLFNLVHSIEDDIVTATIEQDGEKAGLLYQYIDNYIDEIRRELMLPALQAEALKESLKNAVETRVKAAEREAIKQQEKQVITGAWLGITEEARDPLTGKTDYAKAYELLSKPGTLKRYGLTAEQKKTLTGILTNEEAREKEATDQIKEQDRAALLPRISDGTATNEEIDATTLDAKEKFEWKAKLRARSKAINAGEDDPFKVYDPGKRAEISRLIRTDPEDIEKKGGIDYIYSLVGKGKDGGITVEQAERFVTEYEKRNEPPDPNDPLKRETYKQVVGSLDMFRRDFMFIPGDEPWGGWTPEDSRKNEYTYGRLVEELEARVKADPERNPYEILEEIMKPFAEKESANILDWFINWMGDWPAGQTLEETVIKKGAELGKRARIERKEIKVPEAGKISPAKDKRARAIEILMRNKKVVSEETITAVMEQL